MFTVILTVILIMPADTKDIKQSRNMPTLDDCMRAANDWLLQDVKKSGGVGLVAGCSLNPIAGTDG